MPAFNAMGALKFSFVGRMMSDTRRALAGSADIRAPFMKESSLTRASVNSRLAQRARAAGNESLAKTYESSAGLGLKDVSWGRVATAGGGVVGAGILGHAVFGGHRRSEVDY